MNFVEFSNGAESIFSSRKEVRIVGILDSIFACSLLVLLLTVSISYLFIPSVTVWILIFVIHALQLCIAASLITATFELSNIKFSLHKCRIWFYYSRFFFDWIFPVECFFLIMFIGGNGSQYLWIICGIVNLAFRVVAEKSVVSYMGSLKRIFDDRHAVDLTDFENTDMY